MPARSSGRKGTILAVSLTGFELLLYIVKTWEMALPGLMVACKRGGDRLRLKPWAWMTLGVKKIVVSNRITNFNTRKLLFLTSQAGCGTEFGVLKFAFLIFIF